jgi:hypothetical protein
MPWLLYAPGKDPVPIVQEAGWAPWQVWMGVESLTSAPPGFDPWTVQLVASHYTNYAIPAHTFCYMWRNIVRRYRVCLVQHFKGVMWYKVNCWCKGLKFLGDAGLMYDEARLATAVLRDMLVRPHCSWRMMLLLETHIYIGLKFSHVIVYSPFYAPGRSVWHGFLCSQGRWRSGS